MINKQNKLRLYNLLSTFTFGDDVTVESPRDCQFRHDEADISIISFLLQATNSGLQVIRILSDDTDVFVLLVYWVYKHSITSHVQMERWDGQIWDINATCKELGPKSLEILGVHYLTGSDITSFFFGKGKVTALKN